MRLKLTNIRTGGGTQPRAAIDSEAVDDYADAMREGTKFPPLVVFYDGKNYWLADGFHRRDAAYAAELNEVECDVRQGTLEDAQWYSFSANKTNGLRRTNEDKQRAVKAALAHPKAAGLSDRQIAEHVGVSDFMVREYRKQLESTARISQSPTRTGRDGRTINVGNIGKRNPEPAPADLVSVAVQTEQPAPMVVTPVVTEAPMPPTAVPVVVEHTSLGKRQQILANAAKKRMIDGLSLIRGSCRGLSELPVLKIATQCTPEEIQTWAKDARKSAGVLRRFAARLIAAVGVPRSPEGAA
ncbi:MAG: ParB N-terminal domain-containing protein [Bacteroidota bacterium]